ncbi:MAG TPA: hypothetical protein VGB53_14980 [Rubricoccaceae bacterium]|jgi:hypothetical protein
MRPFTYLLAALVATSGISPTAASQNVPVQTALLQSPSPAASDAFGNQVALSGSTAFVNSNGPAFAGSVFVYDRAASGGWALTTTLRPGTTSDVAFGRAISASGDRVAIAAEIEVSAFVRRGVTYLFRRNAQTGAWQQEARLVPTESEPNDAFGSSLSLDGEQLAVGAPLVGAVYVFERAGGAWAQRARIFGGRTDSRFGNDVAIEDNLLVASAPLESYNNTAANGGAVYVYRHNPGAWTQEANLVRQPVAGQRVRSFALRNGIVLVTRPNGPNSVNNTVAAFRYVSASSAWSFFTDFTIPAQNSSGFGSRLAISATGRVLVGAGSENGGIGAAYVFAPDASGSYVQTARLVAADRASGDAFGSAVAVWGDTYLVGALGRGEGGVGAAFVFEAPRPPPQPPGVQVVGWGSNAEGVLTIPSDVGDVIRVAAGREHVVALRTDGTVTAWGSGMDGQQTVPAGLSGVTQVAANDRTSYALRRDGTVVGWGLFPPPTGLADVAQISATGTLALALRRDGTVAAWGQEAFGQTTVPAGLADVVQVAACPSFGAALRRNGTVVTWGQLAPAPPAGLANVVEIDCGIQAVGVVHDDLSVETWGSGPAADVPPNFPDAYGISMGTQHGLALRPDGRPTGWGSNASGELAVPEDLYDVFQVEAGDGFSLAVRVAPEAEVQIVHGAASLAPGTEDTGRIEVFINRDPTATTPDARVSYRGASAFVPVTPGQPLTVRIRLETPLPLPGAPRNFTFTVPAVPSGRTLLSLSGVAEELLGMYADNPELIGFALHLQRVPLLFFGNQPDEPFQSAVSLAVINTVTDAPQLDVTVVETGQVLADDLSYDEAAPPALIAPGTYTVEARRSSDGSLVQTSALTIDANSALATLLIAGFMDPAANQNGPPVSMTATDETGAPQGPTASEAVAGESGPTLTVANPMRGPVAVRYTLPVSGTARLVVVDVLGRQVAVLAGGAQAAGTHEARLDAGALAPGVYVLRLDGTAGRIARTVTVVR